MRITAKQAKRLSFGNQDLELDAICAKIYFLASVCQTSAVFTAMENNSKDWLELNGFTVTERENSYLVTWEDA